MMFKNTINIISFCVLLCWFYSTEIFVFIPYLYTYIENTTPLIRFFCCLLSTGILSFFMLWVFHLGGNFFNPLKNRQQARLQKIAFLFLCLSQIATSSYAMYKLILEKISFISLFSLIFLLILIVFINFIAFFVMLKINDQLK